MLIFAILTRKKEKKTRLNHWSSQEARQHTLSAVNRQTLSTAATHALLTHTDDM